MKCNWVIRFMGVKTSYCCSNIFVSHGAEKCDELRDELIDWGEWKLHKFRQNWIRVALTSKFQRLLEPWNACLKMLSTRSRASLFSGIAQTYVNLIEVQTMPFCGSVNKRLSWIIIQFKILRTREIVFFSQHTTLYIINQLLMIFCSHEVFALLLHLV